MDSKPFLEFDLLDMKERHITELRKFKKDKFNQESILNAAEELKYLSLVRNILKEELGDPSDELVSVLINNIYEGVKTAKVKEKFQPIIKKALSEHFNEMVKEKLENAFEVKLEDNKEVKEVQEAVSEVVEAEEVEKSAIETTQEELDGLNLVKAILYETSNIENIEYKDTVRYFNILLEGNVRKLICRFYFNSDKKKYISFPVFEDGIKTTKEEKILLDGGVYEIYKYRNRIKNTLKNCLD